MAQAMKTGPAKNGPAVIRVRHRRLNQVALDFDVAVCGGTLGLLLALALQVSQLSSVKGQSLQKRHVHSSLDGAEGCTPALCSSGATECALWKSGGWKGACRNGMSVGMSCRWANS